MRFIDNRPIWFRIAVGRRHVLWKNENCGARVQRLRNDIFCSGRSGAPRFHFRLGLDVRYNAAISFFAEVMQATDLSSSMESLTYETSSLSSPTNSSSTMGTGGAMSQQQQQQQQTRTKRMRTSFKHHQLRTMKSYFNINQNPDAKDLKQLAQKTGLSKRVLQVSRSGRCPIPVRTGAQESVHVQRTRTSV